MKFRKLKLDSGTWEYFTGKENVVIKFPNGKKKIVSYVKLTGLDYDELMYHGKCREPIKPSYIKQYIEKNFL